jgi:ATP-dependent DNA helicase RecQ
MTHPSQTVDAVPVEALQEALATLGYDAFRDGQQEAIETLLEARRLLLVAPTGGGKSLIYQLPSVLLPGTTLVVSPLIALMQDQVNALVQRGHAATYLASTLDGEELSTRQRNMARGEYKLVYVAPERLAFPGFRALLADLDCPLVAIDEAHCISEWGHDFRPEYMQIGDVLKDLPDVRVLACTATATPVVRDEILERLGLPADTPQRLRGFARPNLSLRIHESEKKKERDRWVDDALAEALGEPDAARGAAIVYAPTRRAAEAESDRLAAQRWRVGFYHAGLEPAARGSVHQKFSDGSLDVVVATNAFGMGIDRADVRGVIHLAPPGSIEAYYQEVGRAGRDGADALGLMLLSPQDMPRRRHLIAADTSDETVIAHRWNLFLELMRLAEGGSCRHDAVLRYFGDEEETLAGCGRCDVCIRLAAGEDDQPEYDAEFAALTVRKALAGVARVHGRFGLSAAVALLRGRPDPRLEREGLVRTTTFGVLADLDEDWLLRLLRRCVTAGWVDFWGGDRPVAILTDAGVAVMQGDRPVRLLLPPKRRAGRTARSGRRSAARAPATVEPLSDADLALFEALRAYRLEVSRGEGVPPYVVASDRTLRDVAQLRPATLRDLELAHGIGPNKAERYGAGLLEVVRENASPLDR